MRPAGGVYAAASALAFGAFWIGNDPELPASFGKASSAALFSGLGLGFAGGTATLFVPQRFARPTLELSVTASLALASLAFAQAPERGVPVYGEYAVASGYALTSLLIGVDVALSPPDAMLGASPVATAEDTPRRALTPWLVYAPAMLGALVSTSRALSPEMGGDDRAMAAALGLSALVPATAGLTLGLLGARRSQHQRPEPWIASGPRGSFGLTLGGAF